MTSPTPFEPAAIFECLLRHGVEHVVIDGLAGVAQDAGWPTYDADIVVDTTVANLERLAEALDELSTRPPRGAADAEGALVVYPHALP